MKIKKISVKNLFGIFNHEIELNLDERITIIHGLNGVGKTSLLRLIDAVFNRQTEALIDIPFSELLIEFDDSSCLKIIKEITAEISQDVLYINIPKTNFIFTWTKSGQKKKSHESSLQLNRRGMSLSNILERQVPGLLRIGVDRFFYTPSNEILNFKSAINKFQDILDLPEKLKSIQWPAWLDDCLGHIPVRFVQAQRLILFLKEIDDPRYRRLEDGKKLGISEAVINYSAHLRELIRSKLAESSVLSQSLDRSFPKRLIDVYGKMEELSQEELTKQLNEIEMKRNSLIEVGLYEPEKDKIEIPEVINPDIWKVLTIYIQDQNKKLSVFDELEKKIDILLKQINSRFEFKQMEISKEEGFVFRTNIGELSPDKLSSGEQHELVLTYELLFQTKEETLVLIDEPELSLHVGWQIHFLEDLQKIIDIAQINTLIATHSPQIINNRWDLTVQLGGLEDE